jgi:hypothetical protein
VRLIKFALAVAAAVLLTPSAAQASVDDVVVPGASAWTATGITVYPGVLTVVASGTIEIATNGAPMDPNGYGTCVAGGGWVAPGLPCYSLIGRIGEGPPFALGSNSVHLLDQSGPLYLGVDDEAAAFGDNSGAWNVRIEANTGPGFVCLGGEQCNGRPHPG